MLTFFINTALAGALELPSLFTVSGYKIFFWSDDAKEPVHVHITKGAPSPNTTKLWLTKNGGCILANNAGKIPEKDLHELMDFISAQFFLIFSQWKSHFLLDTVTFYC